MKKQLYYLVQDFFLLRPETPLLINHTVIPPYPCDVKVFSSVNLIIQLHYCNN